jgi:Uma2 family endonuclease
MSAVPKHDMTADEFAEWSARQPREAGKLELIDGRVVVTMQSEKMVHIRLKGRLYRMLGDALRLTDSRCEALVDGALIRITPKRSFQPDGLIHCNSHIPDNDTEVADPIVVYEVLSPESIDRDHGEKVDGYFTVASIQHYLIIDPVRRAVVHHRRGNGEELIRRIYHSGDLALDPPGIVLSIDVLFGPGL